MPKEELVCGLNKGPYGGTVTEMAQGINQKDTETDAINQAEQKAQDDQSALLNSCPKVCPRLANIVGEKPIKGKIVRGQSRATEQRVNLKGQVIMITVVMFGGVQQIPIKIDRDLFVVVKGWQATAVAEWHIDSFKCVGDK